jgi:hypothetical protein
LKTNIKFIFMAFVILICPQPLSSKAVASGYFGYDTQGGSTSTLSPSYCWGNKYGSDIYKASSGEIIDTFIIWCNPQGNNNKIVFGLYTVESNAIRNKCYISDSLTLFGSGVSRWAISANYSLNAERSYTICIDIAGTGGPAVCYASQSNGLSRTNSSIFPDSWSDDVSNNMRFCVAAHVATNLGARRRRFILGGDK